MSQQVLDIITMAAVFLLSAGCLSLYFYCIIDIHKHQTKYLSKKAMWLNFVWFAPVIGSIFYLLNKKRIWQKRNSAF